MPEIRDTFLRWFLPKVARAMKQVALAGHGRIIIEISDGRVRRMEVSTSALVKEPEEGAT